MYERFYGLKRPFDLSPTVILCFTAQHRSLGAPQYGLAGRPGITVIVGEAGTGKTTLVRRPRIDRRRTSSTSNPTLTRADLRIP